MKYLVFFLVLVGFVTWTSVFSNALADSDLNDDYLKFPLDGFYIYADNKHITDILLYWNGESLPYGTITLDEKTNSDINIMIPKNIPRMVNIDFGSSMAVFYTDTLVVPIKEIETDCFYHLRIPVNDADEITIDSISVAAGKLESVTTDDPKCDNVYKHYFDTYEIQPPHSYIVPPLMQFKSGIPFNEIQCKENLVLVQKYDGSPACITFETKIKLTTRGWVDDDMPILDWKKYITVSASRIDKSSLDGATHIIKLENLLQHDLLDKLLVGADGCKNETEICKISGGISLDRTYPVLPSNLFVSDNDMYSVTLTPIQADSVVSVLDWTRTRNENSFYAVIQWDKKYYLFVLSTFDNAKTPDVEMHVIGSSYEPISLKRGEILNYTIQVNTWATYGAPAQIDLIAVQDAKDSGIDVWIEPNIITVPERSNATATLFIKAQDDAKDGIYDIRVIGHANGKLADLYCRNTVCPTVNIGNSAWSIRTFGSGTNMGIGGSQHPENTWMELELNKKEFFEGDMVEINAYLVNNSTEKIEFVPDTLLIKVIKAQPVGYYENLYGIDARYESDKQIVLEPNSKTPLARTFYWNQNTFQNLDDEQRVEPREHKMIATFVGDSYAWNDDVWFGIR